MATSKEPGVHRENMRRQHQKHVMGLALSLVLIVAGISATFLGLEGTFDWAIETPSGIGGKITNASPGILLTLLGFFLAWRVIEQPGINVQTGLMGGKSSIGSDRR